MFISDSDCRMPVLSSTHFVRGTVPGSLISFCSAADPDRIKSPAHLLISLSYHTLFFNRVLKTHSFLTTFSRSFILQIFSQPSFTDFSLRFLPLLSSTAFFHCFLPLLSPTAFSRSFALSLPAAYSRAEKNPEDSSRQLLKFKLFNLLPT